MGMRMSALNCRLLALARNYPAVLLPAPAAAAWAALPRRSVVAFQTRIPTAGAAVHGRCEGALSGTVYGWTVFSPSCAGCHGTKHPARSFHPVVVITLSHPPLYNSSMAWHLLAPTNCARMDLP